MVRAPWELNKNYVVFAGGKWCDLGDTLDSPVNLICNTEPRRGEEKGHPYHTGKLFRPQQAHSMVTRNVLV